MLYLMIFVLKESTRANCQTFVVLFSSTLFSFVNTQTYHWPTAQQQKDKITIKSVRFTKVSSPYEQMLGYCEHQRMLG